ncbi:DUF648 domain-containing protein [Candidatus Chlamydia sanziniae]|uniref:Uncharacterized protein n=1 Tax=Candidatus Chlamydia sanziniae TaxID=1806891 RepID=A0A1A9HV31_9CHLA|nr:DUF648 domain-containing protein [Candidatus Chlamydia sanziniae]ANH78849.1 hypothetical protein Cs308_0679 [Candidatus Chlamydia sanziniae]
MSNLSFSLNYKPSGLEKTIQFLDNCLTWGGKENCILGKATVDGKIWCLTSIKERKACSTCRKILIVLLYLFIPIVLIFHILRFLLLQIYQNRHYRILYIREPISIKNEALLMPEEIKHALNRMALVVNYLPEKYVHAYFTLATVSIKETGEPIQVPKIYVCPHIKNIIHHAQEHLGWGAHSIWNYSFPTLYAKAPHLCSNIPGIKSSIKYLKKYSSLEVLDYRAHTHLMALFFSYIYYSCTKDPETGALVTHLPYYTVNRTTGETEFTVWYYLFNHQDFTRRIPDVWYHHATDNCPIDNDTWNSKFRGLTYGNLLVSSLWSLKGMTLRPIVLTDDNNTKMTIIWKGRYAQVWA